MAEKKYYWLKLKEDFFRQPRMKKLRRIAGGDTYTVIYLKLQLLSLENEGMLYFEGIEDDFIEELALTMDEDVDNVKFTVMYLMSQGLMEEKTVNEYVLPETVNSIGSETANAERKRRSREKQKIRDNVTALSQGSYGDVTNCHTELELELEKEIDKEIEITTTGDEVELSTKGIDLSTLLISLDDAVTQHWNRKLTKEDVDAALPLLKKLNNNFGMLEQAVEVASQYGERACNWNYVSTIVNSWIQKGYKSEEDVMMHELSRKSDAYLRHLNK
jgi:predicted phage replisome organizer